MDATADSPSLLDLAIVGVAATRGALGPQEAVFDDRLSIAGGEDGGAPAADRLLAAALRDAGAPADSRTALGRVEGPETAGLAAALRRGSQALAAGEVDRLAVAQVVVRPGPDGAPGGIALVLEPAAAARHGGRRIYAVLRRFAGGGATAAGGTGAAADRALSTLLGDDLETAACELVEHAGFPDPGRLLHRLEPLFGRRETDFPSCALGLGDSAEPASGTLAAALLRATLALHHRAVLPLGERRGSGLPALPEGSTLYWNTALRPWFRRRPHAPRQALVLAPGPAGAGGCAAWLEEADGAEADGSKLRRPSELLLFADADRDRLRRRLRRLARLLERRPDFPTARLADRYRGPRGGAGTPAHRLAVVAADGGDLGRKLAWAEGKLADPRCRRIRSPGGVFYGDPREAETGKTLFLLPGQGSQYRGMLADLCLRFPEIRGWFEELDRTFADLQPFPHTTYLFPPPTGLTAGAQDSIRDSLAGIERGGRAMLIGNLALAGLAERLLGTPDLLLGYSNGENAALIASGLWHLPDRREIFAMLRRVKLRERELGIEVRGPRGLAVAVGNIERRALEALLAEAAGRVHLALDSCPSQVVLFGRREDMEPFVERLRRRRALCIELPFDHAYHTPIFADKAKRLARLYAAVPIGRPRIPVFSCHSLGRFPDDPAAVRELALRQWTGTVRFREAIEQLYREGVRVFVEAGPNGKLTGFVNDTLAGKRIRAVALDREGVAGLRQLQCAAAELFVAGLAVDPSVLRPGLPAAAGSRGRAGRAAPAGRPPLGAATRRALERGHSELMTEFLDAQRRSAALVFARLGGAGGPARADSGERDRRWPMLPAEPLQASGVASATVDFDARVDLYLRDHAFGVDRARPGCYDGFPVVPFTFGMELAAELAVRAAGGGLRVVALSEVRAHRWLALDTDVLSLEARCRPLSGNGPGGRRWRVELFEQAAGPAGPAFAAVVSLAPRWLAPGPPVVAAAADASGTRTADADAFHAFLFHGDSLRSIRRLAIRGDGVIEAGLEVPRSDGLFAHTRRPVLQLPAQLLDSFGQLTGYRLLERGHADFGVFPFRLESYRQHGPPPPPGTPLTCRARVRFDDVTATTDLDYLDGGGRIVFQIEGARLRMIRFPGALHRFLFHGAPPPPAPGDGRRDGDGDLWRRAVAHRLRAAERDRDPTAARAMFQLQ